MADAQRPEAPILDVDESKDIKAFYHNVAYKTGRVHINIEKMKVRSTACGGRSLGPQLSADCPGVQILKERLQECVRKEGVNYIDRCDQVSCCRQPASRRARRCKPLTAGMPPAAAGQAVPGHRARLPVVRGQQPAAA